MRRFLRSAIAMFAIAIASQPAHGLTIGMIDTFQSGATSGWFAGGGPLGVFPPFPPAVVLTGGPTGANDAYLEVTAIGGAGPGSRLVAMNASQWAGNYLTAGFVTLEMDVINSGPADVVLRLLFEDPAGGPPANIAVSNFGAAVPAGSGWVHIAFALGVADFTALLGDVGSALANTTLLRIIHAPAVGPADPVIAIVGIDNISAGPVPRPGPFPNRVPEPSSLLMLAAAFGVLWLARRRAQR